MQLFRASKYIALVLMVLGMASFASAAIIAPDAPAFSMMMQVGSSAPYSLDGATVTAVPDGDKWKYQIDGHYNQHGYDMTVHFVVEPDPTISGNVTIQNLTTITQPYSFIFTLPVVPGFNPSQLNGSIGLTTTSDSTAGAVSTIAPNAIYTALIDGSSVHTLMNNPFSLPAAAFDSAVATDKFGIPSPIAGGAVTSSIGIALNFSLTPGDQAGITSQFTANPVPEPSSLFGLALFGLALIRRRR